MKTGLQRAVTGVANPLVRIWKNRLTRKFLSTPTSVSGLLLVVAFAAIALLAPLICPPPDRTHPYRIPRDTYVNEPQSFSAAHPLGTTSGQYDILYGLVWGTRTAFRIGLLVTLASAFIGLLVGSISAYYGRALDEVMMRITDIFMTMPFLVAAMVLVTILGQSLDNVMIALIVFGWMSYARLIRSEIKRLKEMDYVQAARAIGATDRRIILRHLLPNAIYPVFVMATMDTGSMVLSAAGLSFLGLGAELGYADWGQMISFARNWMSGTYGSPMQYWHTIVIPGITILLFVLGWNLMGDGLRDILDPRMRGSR